MSIQVDIVQHTIEVQIVEDQVVQVAIWNGSGNVGIQEIVAGTGISVDATNPARPIVSATGGGGGGAVTSVNGETGAVVLDATDVGAQPADADLTAIAALSTQAFGRSLLTLASAAAARAALGILNYVTATPVSVTGTLAETKLVSFLIPANTIQENDILEFWALLTKAGTAGAITIQINVNTSDSLTGDTTLATSAPGAANVYAALERRMAVETTTSQRIYLTSANVVSDITNTPSPSTALSIDFTVDQYFTLSVAQANIGDVTTVRGMHIRVIRQ